MNTKTLIRFFSSFILSASFCLGGVKSSIDLKGASSLQQLCDHIQLTHDMTTTIMDKDVASGYIVARKLHFTGLLNTVYLDGMKQPVYKAKDLPVIRITNFKITPQLKAQIEGYNLFMRSAHLVAKHKNGKNVRAKSNETR